MIRSMTAFARKETQQEWGELILEIRSLNHRYLEISTRLPEDLRVLESPIRERVQHALSRGKLECNLRFQRHGEASAEIELNQERVSRLIALNREVCEILGEDQIMRPAELLRWPGVVEEKEPDLAPINETAINLLDDALKELVQNREREGARLKELIEHRCESMANIALKIREYLPTLRQHHRDRLQIKLDDFDVEVDQIRLEQELVIQAQKLDIDEELDRLDTHIREVRDVLERSEPVGRRLDFLMQELNREANTLGSKSAAMETTQAAVELKVLIEQIREQVQNIE